MYAIIRVEFDDNTGDVEADTARVTEHAAEIARRLTDDEPRVDQADVIEVEDK